MERQDIDNLVLKDLPFYIKGTYYDDFFNRKNITTVGQLLNSDSNVLMKHQSFKVKSAVSTFLKLLKCKYMDGELPYESMLDSYMEIYEASTMHCPWINYVVTLINRNGESIRINIDEILGTSLHDGSALIDEYVRYINECNINISKYNLPSVEHHKFIDFLKWVSVNSRGCYAEYAKTYIDRYLNKESVQTNTVEVLKSQIDSLTKIVNELNNHIVEMQEQIYNLCNENNVKTLKNK